MTLLRGLSLGGALGPLLLAGTLSLTSLAPVQALDKQPEPANENEEPAEQLPQPRAQQTDPMDNARLQHLLERLDAEVKGQEGRWQINYNEVPLYVVTDEQADRMRIMTPIIDADTVSQSLLYRLLQANFDAALDARYAIAQDKVWSTFIHPLSTLTDREFFSGLAQTLVARNTFGTSFSSGALTFGGGDSQEEQRKLYEQIMKDGQAL